MRVVFPHQVTVHQWILELDNLEVAVPGKVVHTRWLGADIDTFDENNDHTTFESELSESDFEAPSMIPHTTSTRGCRGRDRSRAVKDGKQPTGSERSPKSLDAGRYGI